MKKIMVCLLIICCLSVTACAAWPQQVDDESLHNGSVDEIANTPATQVFFKGLSDLPNSQIVYELSGIQELATVWEIIDPALWQELPQDFAPQHLTGIALDIRGQQGGIFYLTSEDTIYCLVSYAEAKEDIDAPFSSGAGEAEKQYYKVVDGSFEALRSLLLDWMALNAEIQLSDIDAYFTELLQADETWVSFSGNDGEYLARMDTERRTALCAALSALLSADNFTYTQAPADFENGQIALELRNSGFIGGLYAEVMIYADQPYAYLEDDNSAYWYQITSDLQQELLSLQESYRE